MKHVAWIVVAAVLFGAGTASAQDVFPLGEVRLKPGAKVAVTDEHGDKVTGRFSRLDTERITIDVDKELRHVPVGQILRIEEVDDLTNGMLIGLGIGATFFIVEAVAAHADGWELTPLGYAVIGSIYGGAGLGVGAGIDALVGGTRTVYRRGAASGVALVPTLRPGAAELDLRFSW